MHPAVSSFQARAPFPATPSEPSDDLPIGSHGRESASEAQRVTDANQPFVSALAASGAPANAVSARVRPVLRWSSCRCRRLHCWQGSGGEPTRASLQHWRLAPPSCGASDFALFWRVPLMRCSGSRGYGCLLRKQWVWTVGSCLQSRKPSFDKLKMSSGEG